MDTPNSAGTGRAAADTTDAANAKPATEVDRNFVASLGRGLMVLAAFVDRRRPMTMAEVSRRTGLPRASVGRSLHTLATMGYVAEDAEHRFFLQPKVVTFAHAYLSCTPLTLAAQPVLDRLSRVVKASCSLGVLDGDDIVFLVRSASSHVMLPVLNTGRRIPACYSAIGRVLLAQRPPDELERYLARLKLVRYNDHTVASTEALRHILQHVRQQDYAAAERQVTQDLTAIAVAVRDASGRAVAGINVIAPLGRVRLADMADRYLGPLRGAAEELRLASAESAGERRSTARRIPAFRSIGRKGSRP